MTYKEKMAIIHKWLILRRRIIAGGEHVDIVDNGIYERMMPTGVAKGPAEIFNIRLEHLSDDDLHNTIEEIRSFGVYAEFGAYDDRVTMALYGKIPAPKDDVEKGVMTWDDLPCYPDTLENIVIKQITDCDDSFIDWCKFLDDCEHNWIFYPAYHFHLIEKGKLFSFLAYVDNKPVARAAIIVGEETAALDFIFTLPEYRWKGIDTALCQHALKYAFEEIGVNHVASYGFKWDDYAYALFTELGFPIIKVNDI